MKQAIARGNASVLPSLSLPTIWDNDIRHVAISCVESVIMFSQNVAADDFEFGQGYGALDALGRYDIEKLGVVAV